MCLGCGPKETKKKKGKKYSVAQHPSTQRRTDPMGLPVQGPGAPCQPHRPCRWCPAGPVTTPPPGPRTPLTTQATPSGHPTRWIRAGHPPRIQSLCLHVGDSGPERWQVFGRPEQYPHPLAPPTPRWVATTDTHPHELLRVPPRREPKMTPTPKHRPSRLRAVGRSSGADRSARTIWAAREGDGG